jgi:hypothetical protein
LTRSGSGGVSRTVGFCSSSWRKAAQKLKQRRVDLDRPLLLKPVADILHQPDVAKVGALLTHQFDHIDAGYHAEDRFEAASHKGGRVRNWLAVKRGNVFEIAFGVAIAIERAPEATVPKLANEVIEISLSQPGRKRIWVDEATEKAWPCRIFDPGFRFCTSPELQ